MCEIFGYIGVVTQSLGGGGGEREVMETSGAIAPGSTRFLHGYKTNQSVTYKAKAAVCSEIVTKHSMQASTIYF